MHSFFLSAEAASMEPDTKTLAGDALYDAQLKTGARGARDFVHSYGRDGFETPIAARSDSDHESAAD